MPFILFSQRVASGLRRTSGEDERKSQDQNIQCGCVVEEQFSVERFFFY